MSSARLLLIAAGLPLSAAQSWTGSYLVTEFQTADCTGTSTLKTRTSMTRIADGLCIRHADSTAWTRLVATCSDQKFTQLVATGDCDSTCSTCTGQSATYNYPSPGRDLGASNFDGTTCRSFTMTNSNGGPFQFSEIVGSLTTTSGDISAVNPCATASTPAPTAAPTAAPVSIVYVNGVTIDYYVGSNCDTWDSSSYYTADTCYADVGWNGVSFYTASTYFRVAFSSCTSSSFGGYEYYYSTATSCAASAASSTHTSYMGVQTGTCYSYSVSGGSWKYRAPTCATTTGFAGSYFATVDAPCFAADTTTACKLTGDHVTPAEARRQCYDEAEGADAELVLMKTLAAGDVVLAADAAGALSLERVVVNQHKANPRASALLEVHHSAGVLSLTPDHVLLVDGAFVPARDATPGSVLTLADGNKAVVERVAAAHGAVINPVTASGTILADGVVAATHPEWSAAFMMATKAPLPLFYAAAAALPATTQAYYDAVLEPLFDALGAHVKPAALGASALVAPFVAADAAAALGLALFAGAAPTALLVLGAAALRSRKA